MVEIKRLYNILEDMVEAAIERDGERVLELDKSYEALVSKVYHDPITALESDYENCRQSCVLSVTMPTMHEEFISDARKRFSKICGPIDN